MLDDPSLPAQEMLRNLRDLDMVNRRWGASRALERWLVRRLREGRDASATVLDVGAGSGAVSRRLRRAMGAAGVRAEVFALDVQWRHLAAGRRLSGGERLPEMTADALALPLPDRAVDWVVSTLLAHHLPPERVEALLAEAARVSRRGFALLDLRRHRAPLAFLALVGRFAFESPVSLHDGLASVRQAYTPAELRAIAQRAAPGARVRRLFPYRLLITRSGP